MKKIEEENRTFRIIHFGRMKKLLLRSTASFLFLLIVGEILASSVLSPAALSADTPLLSLSQSDSNQETRKTWILSLIEFAEESSEEKNEKEDAEKGFATPSSLLFLSFQLWPSLTIRPLVEQEFKVTHIFELFLRNRQFLN